jgi:hypothetical protein
LSRTDLLRQLEQRGILIEPETRVSEDVLKQMLDLQTGSEPLDPPARVTREATLFFAPRLSPGCLVCGFLEAPVTLGAECMLGPLSTVTGGPDTPSTVGAGNRIEGSLAAVVFGEGNTVSAPSVVRHSRLGDRNLIGGKHGSGAEAAVLNECTVGDENLLMGRFFRTTVGEQCHLDGEIEGTSIGSRVVFRRSFARRSLLGDETEVLDGAYLDRAALVPFARRIEDGSLRIFSVKVLRARVSDSLIWGGSDLNDGVVVRGRSVIGPFVHLGAGSEAKSALLRGAGPESTVEVPHRGYLGNTIALAVQGSGGQLLYADPAETATLVRYLRSGQLLARRSATLAPGGFHESEELDFTLEGVHRTVAAQGINMGALFTTSNFDPRAGGSKWPTLVAGGMRMGITSMAQAPALLPESGLLASGAKYAGGKAGRGSLLLGSLTRGGVKNGWCQNPANRLGSAIREKIELTLSYLHNLEALLDDLKTILGAAPRLAEEREPLEWEQRCLSAQLHEIAGFLSRWLTLLPKTYTELQALARSDPENAGSAALDELEALLPDLDLYREMAGRFRLD